MNGEDINTISPLCQAAVEKDANALAHIMAHIKEIDEKENTVIIIQVENEIGLMGTDRDYSIMGEIEFAKNVPVEIEKEFSVHGNWTECFGYEAGEYFMAYNFSKAVEYITKAAQREYNLPCYANAWLKQYPWRLGSYPCGGPVASMHKMWKLMAPSLFCLAPDIYVSYVPQIMDEYTQNGNVLFIPEVRKDAVTASYALYAFGKYNAIGYSPFAIEEYGMNPEEIKPLYFKYRGTPNLKSFVKTSEIDYGSFFEFENGQWKSSRVLNGDEKMALHLNDKLSCYYIELYKY